MLNYVNISIDRLVSFLDEYLRFFERFFRRDAYINRNTHAFDPPVLDGIIISHG